MNGNMDVSKNTGNVARQTLSFNGLANPFVTNYKYDSVFRLTEARETQNSVQTWKQNFTYDRYGNRVTHDKFIGTTQLTLDAQAHPTIDSDTNRFEAGQGFTFDKNGNIQTDAQGRLFVFNGDNKQKEVRDGNNVLIGEYFYDGEGKRVKKHVYSSGVLNEVTVFVYSSGKLIAEYSTEPPPTNPTTKWTVTDQLGSPRVLVNSLGEVAARRDFMPFGEEITGDSTYRTTALKYGVGDDVRQKFTGYERDNETGLDFAEARYYNNFHGRFTAVDPLLASGRSANPQTFNRYAYVMNRPLNLIDPTGLDPCASAGDGAGNTPDGACEGSNPGTIDPKNVTPTVTVLNVFSGTLLDGTEVTYSYSDEVLADLQAVAEESEQVAYAGEANGRAAKAAVKAEFRYMVSSRHPISTAILGVPDVNVVAENGRIMLPTPASPLSLSIQGVSTGLGVDVGYSESTITKVNAANNNADQADVLRNGGENFAARIVKDHGSEGNVVVNYTTAKGQQGIGIVNKQTIRNDYSRANAQGVGAGLRRF